MLNNKFIFETIFRIFIVSLCWYLFIYLEANNPDWFGYERIFEDGAWLSEIGQDYGFILLVNTFKSIFGANYLFFRRILYFVFTILLLYFTSNKFFNTKHTNIYDSITFLIVCIPLFILRYTVQIREGLAISFILFGLNSFMFAQNNINSLLNKLYVLIIFIIAASIHQGVIPFFSFFLLSIIITSLNFGSKQNNFIIRGIITFLFFIIFSSYLILYLYNIKDSYYTGGEVEIQLTFSKVIFWLINGYILLQLSIGNRRLKSITNNEFVNNYIFNIFIILPIIFYLIGMFFLFTQMSNSVLSGISRIISYLMCINLLIISKLHLLDRKIIFLISIFLIFSQGRALIASLTYNDFL